MAVPQLGTYLSEDGNFKLEITSANPSNGQIGGTYETQYSPEGGFKVTNDSIAQYSWVFNDKQGKDGVAPFSLSIQANVRPEGRPYSIYDRWAGAYQTDNSLLMEGSRSYVNSKGVVEAMSLGTLRFTK